MSPRSQQQFEEIREERKAAIERAALEVFAIDGYHLASVSKIAKEAGVSKGLMYNYFESKEELLKCLIRDSIAEAMQRIKIPMDRPLERADVIQFVDDSFDAILEEPKKWKLFLTVFMQQDVLDLMKDEMMQLAVQYIEPFMTYFSKNGFEEDPMSAVVLFHSMIDGVQMKLLMDVNSFPIEGVKKMIIKLFIPE